MIFMYICYLQSQKYIQTCIYEQSKIKYKTKAMQIILFLIFSIVIPHLHIGNFNKQTNRPI